MAMLPYEIKHRIDKTYDGQYQLILDSYCGATETYIYGTLESFGKLLYRLGESAYVYESFALTYNCKSISGDDVAYEVWTSIVAQQGNKKGRKNPASVYLISDTGEVIKHYRFASANSGKNEE